MPRLGPSCLVLFSPRMLLHPYIHLAGYACKKGGYESRGAIQPGQEGYFVRRTTVVLLFYIKRRRITPRSFYLRSPNSLTVPITHLSTGATGNHPDQESWNEPKIDRQYDH